MSLVKRSIYQEFFRSIATGGFITFRVSPPVCSTSAYGLWIDLAIEVAKSWNLQILDSREHPERGVIFFWGNLIKTPKGVKVKSIVGFPEGIRGDVIIREVPHKQVQDHR
jgi:hypothetical protein